METGVPYILYKDHINKKSNHKNIGIIKIKHEKYLKDNIIINSSNQIKKSYTNYYDDECLQRINTYFKKEFETFNFKMCKNMDELIEDSKKYIISDEQFIYKNKKILNDTNTNTNTNTNTIKYLTEIESFQIIDNKSETKFQDFILHLTKNLKPTKLL